MMELVNALYAYKDKAKKVHPGLIWEVITDLLLVMAPFVPHITEELWHGTIDDSESIHKQAWPKYDEEAIKVDEVEVLVEVNGKPKDRIMVDPEMDKGGLGQGRLGKQGCQGGHRQRQGCPRHCRSGPSGQHCGKTVRRFTEIRIPF